MPGGESHAEADRRRIAKLLERKSGTRTAAIRNEMATELTRNMSVFRTEESMQAASAAVEGQRKRYDAEIYVEDKGKLFNTDLLFALELDFMLDTASAICAAALTRRESRGAHYRTDMPERDDDNWLKHTMVQQGDDQLKIETSPVAITDGKPQKRVY